MNIKVVFGALLALSVSSAVSCRNIACGSIKGSCEVVVRDQHGNPVSGVTAIWVDKADDLFWRMPDRYEICTTGSQGVCSGSFSHRISQQTYGWSAGLPESNYSVVASRDGREIGAVSLASLSGPQVSGREPLVVNISVRVGGHVET